jgi:hypothetical protein
MKNEMLTTANCPSSFRHRGVTVFSRWSESMACSLTPNHQSVLHHDLLQLHRRVASLESILSSAFQQTFLALPRLHNTQAQLHT